MYLSKRDSAQSHVCKLAYAGIYVKPSKAILAFDTIAEYLEELGLLDGPHTYFWINTDHVIDHEETIKLKLFERRCLKDSFSSAADQRKIENAFKLFIVEALLKSDYFGFNTVRKFIYQGRIGDTYMSSFFTHGSGIVPSFSESGSNTLLMGYMRLIENNLSVARKEAILSEITTALRTAYEECSFKDTEAVFGRKIELFTEWILGISAHFDFASQNF